MPKIPALADPDKSLAQIDAEKKLQRLEAANPTPPPAKTYDEQIKAEVAERRQAKKKEPERPILYPTPSTILCIGDGSIEGTKTAVARAKMAELLWYETEDQWKDRVKKEMNDVVAVSKLCAAGFGEDFLYKNLGGQKVRCWNNTKNRSFSLSHMKELAQEILHSGPGLPKEKRRWQWNGESFIVGDRAQVISGQHRGIGLLWACDEWKRNPDKWKIIWPTEPTLDILLVFGVPELPYVLRTIDNVMPRKLSDVFYTSELFAKLNPRDREECSRMLMNAVDLSWTRTGVDTKYQTHGESVDYLDRHPRLLRCVKDLFDENSQRKISLLKLSPGRCAALQYLFGCSKSSLEKYSVNKTEKSLDWSMWDKAKEFFILISAQSEKLAAVRTCLGYLIDEDTGSGGRQVEKHALLCKAWNLFSMDKPVTEKALELAYGEDANGITRLLEHPTIGGIDLGEKTHEVKDDAKTPEPTEAEVEAAKAAERKKRADELDAKAKAANKKK